MKQTQPLVEIINPQLKDTQLKPLSIEKKQEADNISSRTRKKTNKLKK